MRRKLEVEPKGKSKIGSKGSKEDVIQDDKSNAAGLGTCNVGEIPTRKSSREQKRVSWRENGSRKKRSRQSGQSDLYVQFEGSCHGENPDTGSSVVHTYTCAKDTQRKVSSYFDDNLLKSNGNRDTHQEMIEKTANDERTELDDASTSDETALSDESVIACPGPEFNDFLRHKLSGGFAVNQVWALYADDGMPRYYARIDEVISPEFELRITWLEPKLDNQRQQSWFNGQLPVGCGEFESGETETIKEHLLLSHRMDCFRISRGGSCFVYPRKGDIWAVYKDWDVSWNSIRGQHKSPYRYEFVQVLSDFEEDEGIGVQYLSKLEGFVSLFRPVGQNNVVAFTIAPGDIYRFSHKIPSFKMRGRERGVPEGSFELDPAAVPDYLFELDDTGSVEAHLKEYEKQCSEMSKSIGIISSDLESKQMELGTAIVPSERLSSKLHSKRKKLISLCEAIKCCDAELKSKAEQIESQDEMMERYRQVLKSIDIEINTLKEGMITAEQNTESSKKELCLVQSSVAEVGNSLNVKKNELSLIEKSIVKCSELLRSKEEQLDRIENFLKIRSLELAPKELELELTGKRISECIRKLGSKQEELCNSIERSLRKRTEELERKRMELNAGTREFEVKEREYGAHLIELEIKEKEFEKRMDEVKLKEKEGEKRMEEVKLKEKEGEKRMEEVKLKEKEGEKRMEEVKLKEKEVEKRMEEVKLKQKEVEKHTEEINFKEEELASCGRCGGTPEKFQNLSYNRDIISLSENNRFRDTMADICPHIPLNESDLFHNGAAVAFGLSRNPAKFVLDMIRNTILRNREDGTHIEEGFLKKCTRTLEEFITGFQQRNHEVQAEAKKVAFEWKGRMKSQAQTDLEVLGFLQFLSAYGLVNFFDGIEVFELFGVTLQYEHAPIICQGLGFRDDVPHIVSYLIDGEMYTAAVRFILSFKLADQFQPIPLLRKEISNLRSSALTSLRERRNSSAPIGAPAIQTTVVALKAVRELIVNYKLGEDLPVQPLTELITILED